MTKIKEEYESLLESNELFEIYPELTGKWDKDNESFSNIKAKEELQWRNLKEKFYTAEDLFIHIINKTINSVEPYQNGYGLHYDFNKIFNKFKKELLL